MPDKHEVGGSTPLEPTSRQCRHPIVKVAVRNRSKLDRQGFRKRKSSAEIQRRGKEKENPRRRRMPEKQDRYVNLAKAKNT